jgi:UPF0716 family protein affecting phage T7 exclusion
MDNIPHTVLDKRSFSVQPHLQQDKKTQKIMIRKTLRTIAGIIMIILGIIGFFLPLTPGWAMVFIGVLLISPERGKRLIAKIKEKLGLTKKT